MLEGQEILQYLPHRAPMLFVEKVLSAGSGQAQSIVRIPDLAEFGENGVTCSSVCLEFMAQSAVFACLGGCRPGGVKAGYVVALRELELYVDQIRLGVAYLVEVLAEGEGETLLCRAQVNSTDEPQQLLARARFTVFSPTDIA